MPAITPSAQDIYLAQMTEVRNRLNASRHFINLFTQTDSPIDFDSSVLQFRKALEATAYASIAPNKETYQNFRQKDKTDQDFTKDFKASRILRYLEQINRDFYPLPLICPTLQTDRTWHYERKQDGFLTLRKFTNIYDRLGKFLHADNPWDTNKHRQNLVKDILASTTELSELLVLHATFIKTKQYSQVWVIELPLDKNPPTILTGCALGDFVIEK